jgi:hypothetical protein
MTTLATHYIGDVRIDIEEAPEIKFPGDPTGGTDCNSPVWWSDDTMHILNSTGHPYHSYGPDLTQLGNKAPVTYSNEADGGRWIESVHQEEDGTLYGWYHNEPLKVIPDWANEGRPIKLTAPKIGAVISRDDGAHWEDLGIVIEGGPDTMELNTKNYYFTGGNGDFSVILDREGEYFYFVIGTYYKDPTQQGVSIARMRYADKDNPAGKVQKWHNGGWSEPGMGGEVTPILPVRADWNSENPDTLWGPSVHWNNHIKQYVILLNRAVTPDWGRESIYLCLTPDISDPTSWTEPLAIMEAPGWYPQVVGVDVTKRETEREAGHLSRLFIHGTSRWLIRFSVVQG